MPLEKDTEMNKMCIICGVEKELSKFPHRINKNGDIAYGNICHSCQARDYRARQFAKVMNDKLAEFTTADLIKEIERRKNFRLKKEE